MAHIRRLLSTNLIHSLVTEFNLHHHAGIHFGSLRLPLIGIHQINLATFSIIIIGIYAVSLKCFPILCHYLQDRS